MISNGFLGAPEASTRRKARRHALIPMRPEACNCCCRCCTPSFSMASALSVSLRTCESCRISSTYRCAVDGSDHGYCLQRHCWTPAVAAHATSTRHCDRAIEREEGCPDLWGLVSASDAHPHVDAVHPRLARAVDAAPLDGVPHHLRPHFHIVRLASVK